LQWAGEGERVVAGRADQARARDVHRHRRSLPSQLILVEVVEGTPYGRIFRLASQITALEGGTRFSTKTIDRAMLPVDGIIREGRYLLLAPDAPIAFATGTVHLGINGPATAGARVLTPSLGVVDLTRITGIFNVPVPAAVFSLIPRTIATGDGATYTHPTAPAVDAVVHVGALSIVAQPPTVTMTVFAHRDNGLVEVTADGATEVAPTTSVKASFSPGLDPQSVKRSTRITVIDDSKRHRRSGTRRRAGHTGILWTLEPGTRLNADTTYTAVVSRTCAAANGTPLGNAVVATFSTVSALTSPERRPSKIRITMPDAMAARRSSARRARSRALERRRRPPRPRLLEPSAGHRRRAALVPHRARHRQRSAEPRHHRRRDLPADHQRRRLRRRHRAARTVHHRRRPRLRRARRTWRRATRRWTTSPSRPGRRVRRADAGDASARRESGNRGRSRASTKSCRTSPGFKIDFEGWRRSASTSLPGSGHVPAGQSPILGYHGMSSRGPRIMVIDLLRRDGDNLTTTHPPMTTGQCGASSARFAA
jgi:hypothetical protein